MKNNEESIYFSKIGKKLNIKYGNVFIEHKKNNKKLTANYIRQQLENLLLNEEEKSKNRNIFDSFLKKRNKLLLEEDTSSDSFFDNEKEKKSFNNYKYYQLHLDKIKRLKTSNNYDEKPRELVYAPIYDLVDKKIITGPKWNTMTGRKKEKNIKVNNSFNICSKELKKIKKKQKEVLKKLKIIPLKKNYSAVNITHNLQKIVKNLNLNHKYYKPQGKNKICERYVKNNEIKNTTPKKEKTLMNSFPKLNKSKIYLIKETDIKDRYLKNVFFIKTTNNEINQKKSLKTDIKIFRNKQIGLNYEQLKIINAFKDDKASIKEKIKKLKIKKILNKKYKLLLTDNRKNNENKKLNFNTNNNNQIRLFQKSFNYFINKPKYIKNDKCMLKKNKSFYLSHPLYIKNYEFYKYNVDDLNEYNFSKFDNITFKSNCNK